MNKKHLKSPAGGIIIIFLLLFVTGLSSDYFGVYLLSLNGRVKNINIDIKEVMHITVSGKEHNLSHHWPKLQRNIKVGDSVYKQPKCYDIILVKQNGMRFICPLEDK